MDIINYKDLLHLWY